MALLHLLAEHIDITQAEYSGAMHDKEVRHSWLTSTAVCNKGSAGTSTVMQSLIPRLPFPELLLLCPELLLLCPELLLLSLPNAPLKIVPNILRLSSFKFCFPDAGLDILNLLLY